MIDWQLYLALVIAIGLGFFLGARYGRQEDKKSAGQFIDENYFKGLNLLLNEQPDEAIETFIAALEVNSETLETHLALGKLLRKQGEVDRAIRIHQNLLARPGLTLGHVQQAQYELATDFVKSGLFDRAEALLVELVDKSGPYRVNGLERLLEIYRDEKEWGKGLGVLQQLSGSKLSRAYDEWAPIRAHFCCELSEEAILEGNYRDARQYIKQALSFDRDSIRVGLLLGRLEIEQSNYSKGIAQLQNLAVQNDEYLGEIIPLLSEAYAQSASTREYRNFLTRINSTCKHESVLLALSELIASDDGELAAAEYVAQEVIAHPSGIGLHKLLDYYLHFSEGKTKKYLVSLQEVMNGVIADNVHYRCKHCGFKAQALYWLCPSCKKWGGFRVNQ